MQLTQKQLNTQLATSLAALYLISGDVPLFIEEARAEIIRAANARGFTEKSIVHIESGYRIETLITTLKNTSLFDQQKIIDIRNPDAKFDPALVAVILDFLKKPLPDRLVIISTSQLTPAQKKTLWFDGIKKSAVFIPIFTIAIEAMPAWIILRAQKKALSLTLDAAQLLAALSEGHLLAAEQALEKCSLLYPRSEITREQLQTLLTDHARFSIFDLSDAIAQKKRKKIIRILLQLEQSGSEPALVLWSICRKIREVILASRHSQKAKKALQFAAHIDLMIKGAKPGNTWDCLLQLSLEVSET